MKRFLLISAISFFAVSTAFSTEQTADILVIGRDTIYLKWFPLEELRIKNKFKAPFDYGGHSFPHTGCWRGYVATWQIVENNLVLKEVQKLDTEKTKLNIIEYLENNNYNPKTINGFVLADWYSDTLKYYKHHYNDFRNERFYISKDFSGGKNKKTELIFENGKLIENNIIPIEDFNVGDTLYVDTQYYFQDWWDIWEIGYNIKAQLKGVVRENNGEMVRLEIISYGTDKKRRIRKIQSKIDLNNFWANPRYCRKIE
jgi:hypothetical protein